MLRNERDLLSKSQRDYELKLKDLETIRTKLEKNHLEEVERFKSEYSRGYKDQEHELHRRKLLLEEDEQSVRYEKDRIARIESRNFDVEKELKEQQEDLKRLKQENHSYHKEILELKDHIKTLESALKHNLDLKAT